MADGVGKVKTGTGLLFTVHIGDVNLARIADNESVIARVGVSETNLVTVTDNDLLLTTVHVGEAGDT